jgi:Polysaccharide pyruvyl transferase
VNVLLAGWFSFENGHATAGDLITRDVVASWLESRGWRYDVAVAPPFEGDVRWDGVDGRAYDAVVFACGPFQQGELEEAFLAHFRGTPVYGVNLSMVESLETFDPFASLWERDSDRATRPDLTFVSEAPLIPVVGVCKVEPYPGGLTEVTDPAIDALVERQAVAGVPIDTRLDANTTGLGSPAAVESLIARLDAVVTTRLHGFVLALKNGVPAVPIDPEAGGFKIVKQAAAVGWPLAFVADRLDSAELDAALDYCLTPEARREARACAEYAQRCLASIGDEVLETLAR